MATRDAATGRTVTDLGWYAHRFRSMSARELAWRAVKPLQAVRIRGTHRDNLGSPADLRTALERFRSGVDRPVLLDRQRAQEILRKSPTLVDSLLAEADLATQGAFRFFGYPRVMVGSPIDWNYDPVSGVHWPRTPSRRINHRFSDGDVKWIWELNRLQHLPWLAQAWLFTGDRRYERAAFGHLDSWIAQNPPGRGVGWTGAFESGIRAISIAIALQGFRDSDELTVDRFQRILTVLAESARRCWQDRSLFSSANNHLVGEMTGLAVIALIFPELRSSSEWEASAVSVLSAEAGKQILADGAGAEQAVGYQMFTVELLNLVAILLTDRDGNAPTEILEAIARSSSFLFALVGDQDPSPRYGDNDEGFALRLGPEAVRTVRDHLGIVSACGPHADARVVGHDTLAAQWFRTMAHNSPEEPGPPRSTNNPPVGFFAGDGGLVVMRNGRCRTTMDVGPLGYLSIAAHGHADALAITLSIDGDDVITDPGTGSYHGHPEWRSAMRATRAHATVSIDGQDQSINSGPFMWSRHARVRVRDVDLAAGIVDAEHDGYTRLSGHPVHRRILIAPRDQRSLLVVDVVVGGGHHEVRSSWPLHPSLDVKRTASGHIIIRNDCAIAHLMFASSAPLLIDAERGNVSENLGWWSERLESRTPAWWLGAVGDAELPIVIATHITPTDGPATNGLAVELLGNLIRIRWTENDEIRTIDIPGAGDRRPSPRAVWLSPSLSSRGGISSYIRNMRETRLWREWDVNHIATHRDGGIATRIAVFASAFGRFLRQLVTDRPDIAHINMASGGSFVRKFLLMWTAKAFQVPVVLHIHGGEFDLFADRAPQPVHALVRTALEHADVVIALGSAWAEELRRVAPGAHVEVVPNAVRPHRSVPQAVAGPVHVVFLGEVGKRKGTFVLLEAWSKLMESPDCRPARLTVAGNGEVGRARDLVSELGIEASVEVCGWLSDAAAATLLDESQVLVLPSLNEGQPMAILEAMSRGLCVVASKAGGIPEMLGVGGGILVDPEDVDALARTLFHVVNNSDERVRYGTVARNRIQDELNIEVAADRIDQLYRRTLKDQARRKRRSRRHRSA